MGAISSGKVVLGGANLLIHSSKMASVKAWSTCEIQQHHGHFTDSSWEIKVNCEIKFVPQRWGRWLQSETKRWFHSVGSGQGCEGCWQIHPARRPVFHNPPEHSCYFKRHDVCYGTEIQQILINLKFSWRAGEILTLNNSVIPETKGGVGEIWRAVKVSDSKAAPDVVHGGHRRVASRHDPSLNRALIGTIAKSHQAIVVIQTRRYNNVNILVFFIIIQPIQQFSQFLSISGSDLLQTTPHLENLDRSLMRAGLSGFRPPSIESVQMSHSLWPVAKFQ